MVRDWNDMERIWQYVYSKDQLQTFSEEVWQPARTRPPPNSQLCPPAALSFLVVPATLLCILLGPAASSLCVCGSAQSVAAK